MPAIWRFVLLVYSLLLTGLAAVMVAASTGWREPLDYIDLVFSSSQNRIIAGTLGIVIAGLVLALLSVLLKTEPHPDNVAVDKNLLGEISISVAAIKLIIMKAVREVSGVKDIRPSVSESDSGVVVKLHMMVNPERSVPELSQAVQKVVKEYLENIGGLQVAEIKVLVDDLSSAGK